MGRGLVARTRHLARPSVEDRHRKAKPLSRWVRLYYPKKRGDRHTISSRTASVGEALFLAGIHPKRRADRVSLRRMHLLASAVRTVLERAIEAGGTTLRDFHGGDGEPGWFSRQLSVYGREGLPCLACKRPISVIVLGQRSTFYCGNCQR